MTVSSTTQKVRYSGDDSTVAFTVTFGFAANADIVAIHRDSSGTETTWVLDTDYTLTGAGADSTSGTLTATTAPATGETLTIKRVVTGTQTTDYPPGGDFPAGAHEAALDKLTHLVQELRERFDRSILLPATTTLSGIALPEPGSSELVRWNSGGTALETVAVADLGVSAGNVTVSSFMETVLDDEDAGTARTTLGAGTMSDLSNDTTPQLGGTLDTNSKQVRWSKGTDVASANALTLGTDGNYFDITGAVAITSIGTLGIGTIVKLHFDSTPAVTHHATDIIMPGGATVTAAANDEAEFVEYDTGKWRCTVYTKADGTALVTADLPRSYLAGLQMTTDTDADHDISVAAGTCRNAANDGDITIASAQVKQIDASWASGTGAGGLASNLTVANNTVYHYFAIVVSGVDEIGIDTSFTAANLVSQDGATANRRIGSRYTDGSANIVKVLQEGDRCVLNVPATELSNGTIANAGTTLTMSVPTGFKVHVVLTASVGTLSRSLHFYSPDATGAAPGHTAPPIGQAGGAGSESQGMAIVLTNTSAQVVGKANSDCADASVTTLGWIDTRGRND